MRSTTRILPRLASDRPTLKQVAEEATEYFEQNGSPRMARWDRPCAGCANSVARAPYPGHPAGETPCMICDRNPSVEECQKSLLVWKQKWESNPARQDHKMWFERFINNPIDNYKTCDVMDEHSRTVKQANKQVETLVHVLRSATKARPTEPKNATDTNSEDTAIIAQPKTD